MFCQMLSFFWSEWSKFALYQVRVRIGSPVTGYGQESRNRAARQRIPNRTWTDEDGVDHVEVISYCHCIIYHILALCLQHFCVRNSFFCCVHLNTNKAVKKLFCDIWKLCIMSRDTNFEPIPCSLVHKDIPSEPWNSELIFTLLVWFAHLLTWWEDIVLI